MLIRNAFLFEMPFPKTHINADERVMLDSHKVLFIMLLSSGRVFEESADSPFDGLFKPCLTLSSLPVKKSSMLCRVRYPIVLKR